MNNNPIYLDYMATTPIDPRVVELMHACLRDEVGFGNPSSDHWYGRRAKLAIEQAREQLAETIGAKTDDIVWTSGATEAINLALFGVAHQPRYHGKHIVTLATEHSAVLNCCHALQREGHDITYLKPTSAGLVDLDGLQKSLHKDTFLVSISFVNSEIGVIQDIAAIGELLHRRGILFHVDAAQAMGKVPIDLQTLPVDFMSFSAHKVYGPKGIGVLYLRQRPRQHLQPLLYGGGQEYNLRAGTLATHQIVGMASAFKIAAEEFSQENQRIQKLHDRMLKLLTEIDGVIVNGDAEKRVPHNLNVTVLGVNAESLMSCVRDKLAISMGSACQAKFMKPSYVLSALGFDDAHAQSAIRLSIGRFSTEDEIEMAAEVLTTSINYLRQKSPLWPCYQQGTSIHELPWNKENETQTQDGNRICKNAYVGRPHQGEVIQLQVDIENDIIVNAVAKAQGMLVLLQAGDYFCELIKGLTLTQAQQLSQTSWLSHQFKLPDHIEKVIKLWYNDAVNLCAKNEE